MSVETTTPCEQQALTGTCSAIELIIYPKEHDLGGFSVRRALPNSKQRMVGPWVFFDHMGPAVFPPGQGVDVRPHPHINLATVTYLFEGEMLHRDSLGNEIVIKPGEINLMVAGKGIVHSERQREEVRANNNVLNGLQLWLALPEADEEIDPQFYHYDANDIAQVNINGVPVRVLIGNAFGVASPVKTFAETLYIEASLNAGQRIDIPSAVAERAVYVASGNLKAMESELKQYSFAVLKSQQVVTITATEPTRIAIIGGEQLPRRYIWWNFVSSRKDRIEKAKSDWQEGKFPKIPGDEKEFIPLPES